MYILKVIIFFFFFTTIMQFLLPMNGNEIYRAKIITNVIAMSTNDKILSRILERLIIIVNEAAHRETTISFGAQ